MEKPSDTNNWETPEEFLELVRKIAPIGLDPCTNERNPVGARVFYTPKEDGIQSDWKVVEEKTELIYCNPPYKKRKDGPGISDWLDKAISAGWLRTQTILLLPLSVDTSWFRKQVLNYSSGFCFWSGRMKFKGAEQGSRTGSLVVNIGPRWNEFFETFQAHGIVFLQQGRMPNDALSSNDYVRWYKGRKNRL